MPTQTPRPRHILPHLRDIGAAWLPEDDTDARKRLSGYLSGRRWPSRDRMADIVEAIDRHAEDVAPRHELRAATALAMVRAMVGREPNHVKDCEDRCDFIRSGYGLLCKVCRASYVRSEPEYEAAETIHDEARMVRG